MGNVVNVEDTMNSQPLIQRPEWSNRVGRLVGWPPLAQNYEHVVAQMAVARDEIPSWCLAQIEAAEQVRQLYEGDLAGAQRDWAILTDPASMGEEPPYNLQLLADAAYVDADPTPRTAGVPNASNRLTQASIDAEWKRIAAVLWPGMDPFEALQANIVLVGKTITDALEDEPTLIEQAQAWLDSMLALTAKVAKDRNLPLWVAAWRVAVATETLHDTTAEVAARVESDDSEPAVLARQARLTSPMDILAIADAGVVALSRVLTDPTDAAGDEHVLITKPLVEAAFVGRPMTDAESVALMGNDPDAAYGTLEAVVRLGCQLGVAPRDSLLSAIGLDRWWTALR